MLLDYLPKLGVACWPFDANGAAEPEAEPEASLSIAAESALGRLNEVSSCLRLFAASCSKPGPCDCRSSELAKRAASRVGLTSTRALLMSSNLMKLATLTLTSVMEFASLSMVEPEWSGLRNCIGCVGCVGWGNC